MTNERLDSLHVASYSVWTNDLQAASCSNGCHQLCEGNRPVAPLVAHEDVPCLGGTLVEQLPADRRPDLAPQAAKVPVLDDLCLDLNLVGEPK